MKMLLICAALAVAGLVRAGEVATPVDLTLPSLSGEDFSIGDLRGQWVVINYWATWCAPCRKEIPELSEIHDNHDDITVLGLAFEDVEPADIEAFLQDYRATYPILLVDVFAPPEPFGSPRALPTTYILDPQGIQVKAFVGPITGGMILEFIDEARN